MGDNVALGVLTKDWVAGRVKTRLIPALGTAAAAELHRALVEYTLRTLAAVGARRTVAIETDSPVVSESAVARAAGPEWHAVRQGPGDLGEHIMGLIRRLMLEGADRVVIIGTDCPWLAPEDIEAALAVLERKKMVLGPADDGGYYLIGLRGPWDDALRGLFTGIDWGTSSVWTQTIAAAERLELAPESLSRLADVDRPEDLPALVQWIDRGGGDSSLKNKVQRILRGTS